MKNRDYFVRKYSLRNMRNENEAKVCKMMEKIVAREEYGGVCFCGVCLEDIYGVTLNNLPPQYRHSSSIKLSKSKVKENAIETEIIKAIKKVRKKPKHKHV